MCSYFISDVPLETNANKSSRSSSLVILLVLHGRRLLLPQSSEVLPRFVFPVGSYARRLTLMITVATLWCPHESYSTDINIEPAYICCTDLWQVFSDPWKFQVQAYGLSFAKNIQRMHCLDRRLPFISIRTQHNFHSCMFFEAKTSSPRACPKQACTLLPHLTWILAGAPSNQLQLQLVLLTTPGRRSWALQCNRCAQYIINNRNKFGCIQLNIYEAYNPNLKMVLTRLAVDGLLQDFNVVGELRLLGLRGMRSALLRIAASVQLSAGDVVTHIMVKYHAGVLCLHA